MKSPFLDHSRILADNLILNRYRKGRSQEEVASEIGVSRSTVTHIESGQGNPSLLLTIQLAKYYGVPVDSLLKDPSHRRKLAFRKGMMISGESLQGVLVRQMRSGDSQFSLKELRIPQDRWFRFKGGPRSGKEFLICEAGEVEVAGHYERVQILKGDFLELVPGNDRRLLAYSKEAKLLWIRIL